MHEGPNCCSATQACGPTVRSEFSTPTPKKSSFLDVPHDRFFFVFAKQFVASCCCCYWAQQIKTLVCFRNRCPIHRKHISAQPQMRTTTLFCYGVKWRTPMDVTQTYASNIKLPHVFSALFCPTVLLRARRRSSPSLPCCCIPVFFFLLLRLSILLGSQVSSALRFLAVWFSPLAFSSLRFSSLLFSSLVVLLSSQLLSSPLLPSQLLTSSLPSFESLFHIISSRFLSSRFLASSPRLFSHQCSTPTGWLSG